MSREEEARAGSRQGFQQVHDRADEDNLERDEEQDQRGVAKDLHRVSPAGLTAAAGWKENGLAGSCAFCRGAVMTSTSSVFVKSASGAISAERNSSASRRSILVMVPIGRPRGNPPARPDVTTWSPTFTVESKGRYLIRASPFSVPSTMPSSRVRCTSPVIALFRSLSSSTMAKRS